MKGNLKVLIADDSELMRLVVKGYLKKIHETATAVEAGDLQETFAIINSQPIDFLFLDINMPNGDTSADTVRELLKIQPELKICMFTGNNKSTLEKVYHAAGAKSFIQKNENMSEAIEEVLRNNFI